MRVSGVNRSGGPADHFHQVLPIGGMHGALSSTDFMVLALPGTDATRGLVDASVLAGLPSHALLINVGRGTTLDTDAMVSSLGRGTLAGAVLDVFETEPLHADDPLWDTPNLLITAHVSAISFVEDIAPVFIANLRRYLSGESPEHLVDFQRGY
jgi:phosphoglycerate dehydrogenase-like enzyme